VDNDGTVRNLVLPKESKLTATFEKDLLGGVVVIRGDAQAVSLDDANKRVTKAATFQAVPYSTWDNRKPGSMIVWLAEQPEVVELPADLGVLSKGVRIRASHVNPTDTLVALNDESVPKDSNDHSIPRMSWWDHKGSTEWVSYRFSKTRPVSECAVYWFDDTGVGRCRVPAEWRLLWLDGNDWKPVKLTGESAYATALDKWNKITFEAVTTREVKLEVKLKKDFSGGILKWTVPEPK
jgi:hypothetical protein